jgi:fumarate reductase flavoprotein subunit
MVKKVTENLKADMVAIGAGGTGLRAAIEARNAGLKNVIVLEKAAKPGGNTWISHAFFAIDSPVQKRRGITANKYKLFVDRMVEADWKVDPKISWDCIDKSAEVMQWFEDRGVVMDHLMSISRSVEDEPILGFHCLERPTDMEREAGPLVIEVMLKECKKLGGIKILTETPAKKIIMDAKGKVSGVVAESKEKVLNISTRAVILAAGGFSCNSEMMDKYFPEIGGEACKGTLATPEITGDSMIMAEEVGAQLDTPGIAVGARYPKFRKSAVSFLARRPHGLIVNKNGERFKMMAGSSTSNQGVPKSEIGTPLYSQPGKVAYTIIDSAILKDALEKRQIFTNEKEMGDNGAWFDELEADLKKDAAEGHLKKADTWDEIAKYIGAKAEVLKATIKRYNAFCDKGGDEDYKKDPKYLIPLRTPPFYAMKQIQGFDSTMGGIKINSNYEVLDKKGNPIPGLYAGGDNAGHFLTIAYKYSGQAMTYCILSGQLSGANAAKYVLGK